MKQWCARQQTFSLEIRGHGHRGWGRGICYLQFWQRQNMYRKRPKIANIPPPGVHGTISRYMRLLHMCLLFSCLWWELYDHWKAPRYQLLISCRWTVRHQKDSRGRLPELRISSRHYPRVFHSPGGRPPWNCEAHMPQGELMCWLSMVHRRGQSMLYYKHHFVSYKILDIQILYRTWLLNKFSQNLWPGLWVRKALKKKCRVSGFCVNPKFQHVNFHKSCISW